MGEHIALLFAGLLIGLVSAALAVWPALSQASGDLPVTLLITLLALIWGFGYAVCRIAVGLALRSNLLEALRRE
jgi:hypothetical protein